MKRLASGLILVMLLLVSVSCTTEKTVFKAEGEKPTLTDEQREIWVERGVLPVSTIEEASWLVGYPLVAPAFIPEGFLPGDFELMQLGLPPHMGGKEWGDGGKRGFQRRWSWPGDRKINFSVTQFQGTLESVQGDPSDICGHSGEREFFEAGNGREYPLVALHWQDGEMLYSVSGFLGGTLSEEILLQIACSVKVGGEC